MFLFSSIVFIENVLFYLEKEGGKANCGHKRVTRKAFHGLALLQLRCHWVCVCSSFILGILSSHPSASDSAEFLNGGAGTCWFLKKNFFLLFCSPHFLPSNHVKNRCLPFRPAPQPIFRDMFSTFPHIFICFHFLPLTGGDSVSFIG